MKLADLRKVLGKSCLVKLVFAYCNRSVFIGCICDLDDKYNDYKVASIYNINDPFDYDPYLRIVIE